MTRHKTRRQKGGDFFSWFSSVGESAKNKIQEGASTVEGALGEGAGYVTGSVEKGIGAVGNGVASLGNTLSSAVTPSTVPTTPVTTTPVTTNPVGGSRRRRSRKMRGGYIKGENLAYYASPVRDIHNAQPSYWIVNNTQHIKAVGGKKSRRVRTKRRKQRRHKK